MTSTDHHNPKCPDYGSHAQNAEDAYRDREGLTAAELVADDFDAIDAAALREYQECEGH
jgi:hypothetical protein